MGKQKRLSLNSYYNISSTFLPSLVNTKTLLLPHRATRMASDQVTEFLNKGYVEAQALYEDDRLSEAIEKAEQPLEEQGIARASNIEDFLLTAARSSPISSRQM